jgi:integrase
MGSLYKQKSRDGTPGRVWWVKYYVNGRPVRESTDTEKEAEAKRFLKLREGAAAAGAPIAPRVDRILYDEVAADLRAHYHATGRWKNLGELKRELMHLGRFFRGRRAASITPDLVLRYITERQTTKTHLGGLTSNATINREVALLRRMLRLAARHGKMLHVPMFELLKEAPPRAGFFEADRYEAVRRHLPEDLRVAVAFAYTYGWRMRSEVLTLERRHVDLRAGTVRLDPGSTKNSEGRIVYLTRELKTLLAGQLDRVHRLGRRLGRVIPYVFPNLSGRYLGHRRGDFRKVWATACRNAGCPGMLKHDFRRTAVRNLEIAGVPRSVAMKITGHKTESVYRRYAIVSDADLQDAVRRLAGITTGITGRPDVAPAP